MRQRDRLADLRSLLTSDLEANLMCEVRRSHFWAVLVWQCWMRPSLLILVRWRIAGFLVTGTRSRVLRLLAYRLHVRNLRTGVDISPHARIGGGLRIAHASAIVIGKDVVAGEQVQLLQSVTVGGSAGRTRPNGDGSVQTMPIIGSDVVLGPGSSILGPIVVGDGAVIAAGAVVLCDVADGERWGGVPARLIGD